MEVHPSFFWQSQCLTEFHPRLHVGRSLLPSRSASSRAPFEYVWLSQQWVVDSVPERWRALCDAMLSALAAAGDSLLLTDSELSVLQSYRTIEATAPRDEYAVGDDEVLYSDSEEHEPSSLSMNLSASTAGQALSRSVSLAPTKSTSAVITHDASRTAQRSSSSFLCIPLPSQPAHMCEAIPMNVIEASLALLSPLEYPRESVVLSEWWTDCTLQLVAATGQVAVWVHADQSLMLVSADGRAVVHYLTVRTSKATTTAAGDSMTTSAELTVRSAMRHYAVCALPERSYSADGVAYVVASVASCF